MRTQTINIYKFNELNEKAKQKAIENYRETITEFCWGDDYIASMERGCEHFGVKLKDYSIDFLDCSPSSYRIVFYDGEVEELNGEELAQHLRDNYLTYHCKYDKKQKGLLEGNCPFTGVCGDEDFLDPVKKFLKKPDNTTFLELIENCLDSCIEAGQRDFQGMLSDDSIVEEIEANDVEFLESGEIV